MATEMAIFGGGCFWCTEAVFAALDGVLQVESGYCGGGCANPSYEQVCSGASGHAEVVRVEFEPERISFADLLAVFFATHDPTTPNRQGNDVGTQYRSVIFCQSELQRQVAQKIVQGLQAAEVFVGPVVTELTDAEPFWPAENYHQQYFSRNPHQPYCNALIPGKLEKLRHYFPNLLK